MLVGGPCSRLVAMGIWPGPGDRGRATRAMSHEPLSVHQASSYPALSNLQVLLMFRKGSSSLVDEGSVRWQWFN